MSKSFSLRYIYLFRMILGVLIISLAVAEVLASKLLSELPLLQIAAGLGILWLIGSLLIRRMDSESCSVPGRRRSYRKRMPRCTVCAALKRSCFQRRNSAF